MLSGLSAGYSALKIRMKIRQDFVSNSSSTSFVIALKGEFTKDNFFKAMGISNKMLFPSLFEEMFKVINRKKQTVKKFLADSHYDTFDDFMDSNEFTDKEIAFIKQCQKDKWHVFIGEFENQCYDFMLEWYLCYTSFIVMGDDIFFGKHRDQI
ncbi:MAG: hypothetical protein LBP22_04380 [Deltaproteobacteria bacterium]|nr:hypothetical protein [Deltaproteobacteria bacterium]